VLRVHHVLVVQGPSVLAALSYEGHCQFCSGIGAVLICGTTGIIEIVVRGSFPAIDGKLATLHPYY
jgi:hypothetical protein